MACDIDQLMEDSKCFQCLSDRQLEMAKAYLLCEILNNGGGGGGGTATGDGGVVDPEGVVTGNQWDYYINTATGTLWFKESVGTGDTGWVQRV